MGTRSAARNGIARLAEGERAGPRVRATVGGAVVLLLVAGAAAVLAFVLNAPGGSRAVGSTPLPFETPTSAPSEGPADGAGILVHVLGAVKTPGLYELADGERIVDAVAAAGGFSDKADQAALNLARVVGDGEQVYVPAEGEQTPEAAEAVEAPGSVGGLVNLNTADAAQLETLPGLGPELAARIVAWREQNGRFSSVDDLLNVTGIGAKTVSGLADLVTT
jgi:competence protein ComEA